VSAAARTDVRVPPYSAEGRPGPDGRRVGVLLCHGFTGSPASMRPWGEHLASLGYAVEVPRLPGHGTTWHDMADTRWDDWAGAVERSHADLVRRTDVVVVGGLSMGGTLALWLAERNPDIAGLMLVNAAVASTNRQLLALPVLKHLIRSMPGIGNDIKKPGADEQGYDRTPLRALASMTAAWKQVRGDLAQVTCPILLFRSAEDHVVDPSSARIIRAEVSSREVSERVLANSYHVATLDNDAPEIFDGSADFIARVTGAEVR
jgi:carboxylesterase